MSRDVPYDPDDICDECGAKGAFDFMGDLLCPKCVRPSFCFETGDDEAYDIAVRENKMNINWNVLLASLGMSILIVALGAILVYGLYLFLSAASVSTIWIVFISLVILALTRIIYCFIQD